MMIAITLLALSVFFTLSGRTPPPEPPAAISTMDRETLLPDSVQPPPLMREFRGLWIATVNNMDWPSRPDLPVWQQQTELLAILDRAATLKLNAIVFQVRPVADAFYASRYEPWSRYLTGRQGRVPQPAWDPLAFAIAEAHRRGLELHAWFNPYRVTFERESLPARTHVSRARPDLVVQYGRFKWMDPGKTEARELMIRSVLDVVRRYDVDGVHIDDYFYPYPETDAAGRRIEFPDSTTYAAYRRRGGQLGRSDWRRHNVDQLVREFYDAVKGAKPWVKVGVSPFGIWRPGHPAQIQGLDAHEEIYADARKWLREGWLDYLAPQLYWPVNPPEQSYPVLLDWWIQQNEKERHVWPGLALYKLAISGPRAMRAADIVQEIDSTRARAGATGYVLFNASVLIRNLDSIVEKLAPVNAEPALVPASRWLDRVAPLPPVVRTTTDNVTGEPVLHFSPQQGQVLGQWIVQLRVLGSWRTTLLPVSQPTYILKDDQIEAEVVSVSAVDRSGNVSAPAIIRRR